MERRINYITKHLADSISVKQNLIENYSILNTICEIVSLQISALQSGKKIMFVGNGGSAADAQHLSTEYVSRLKKNREPLAAVALSTDTSALTAIGNDYGFEQLFARQVKALGNPGDVLVGISTSGNSKNVCKAFEVAREMGIHVVGFLGASPGLCEGIIDLGIHVPSADTAHIQEAHITIGHIICGLVEKEIYFCD